MKKFLLVLGMITLMLGMSITVQAAPVELTQEQADTVASGMFQQIASIVASGSQGQVASDPVAAAACASYEAAFTELGGYKSMVSCEYVADGDNTIITAIMDCTLNQAKFTMVLDNQGMLLSATTDVILSQDAKVADVVYKVLMGLGVVFILFVVYYAFKGFSAKKGSAPTQTAPAGVNNAVAQIVQNEKKTDDLELIAVITAAIAASEGRTSTDGYVVRSIRRVR